MSQVHTSANGHPVPEATLLMICLHGSAARGLGPINAAQILLFSPDPPEAGTPLKSAPDFRHIPAIPGPATTEAEALRFNMPGLASLGEPTAALRELLPGLKITGRVPVHRLGPQDLAPLLPAQGNIAVAMDCPGAEAGVLDALWRCIGPDRITRITLRCGAQAFFHGASGRTGVAQMLQAQGFGRTGSDTSDPDWPVLSFQPDPKVRQIADLQVKLNDLSQTVADLTAAQTRSDAREAQLVAQVQSLQAAKDAVDQAFASFRTETEAARQSLATQQTAAAEAIRKRDQCLADQALSARVQAMQALDLRDLRTQLDHSERERQRQEDLLRKLTPRLAQAAAHLQALQIGQTNAPGQPQSGKGIAKPKPGKLPKPAKDPKHRKAKAGPAL
ncbi:MAG: hypothetical protein Q7J44_05710 [Pseudotabrizicola sp.]|uniref:hypothetical protein n=1 Tax=Pseudotabrizicola sp. TaxID=2939647 RepID=UPI00271C383C|nr:hypothetical protein [Pseudotabrizicola sp.]MDO9638019.1 hypothetical protein [Pseudotabrizicola sp.]